MSNYLFNGLFSGGILLGGDMEGLFDNLHLRDLLEAGHNPTEIDYMGSNQRMWCWKEGDPELLDPQAPFPIRWRENNFRKRITFITFMGVIFTHKEWRKGTVGRRRLKESYTARLLVEEPSLTYLLHKRIEVSHCRVAKLLAEELRVATIDLPELRERWDGKLCLLKTALDWYGWPYRQWKEGALPPEWQWQEFWEWWVKYIHPRL